MIIILMGRTITIWNLYLNYCYSCNFEFMSVFSCDYICLIIYMNVFEKVVDTITYIFNIHYIYSFLISIICYE